MKKRLFVATLAALIPFTAAAHKQWLLPSSTTVSGNDVWVTVDAAVSNDLYYPDAFPIRLDNLVVTAPDGSSVQAQNAATLKARSVFDLNLVQKGTYRIASVGGGLSARWGERPAGGPGGEPGKAPAGGKPPEGKGGPGGAPNGGFLRNATPEDIATKIPKDAKNVEISETVARVETFVTNGTPSAIKPVGKGLELQPETHPNDLFTGEPAKFKLLLDGKPKPGLDVLVVRGATRYRNAQDEIRLTTDANGEITVNWQEAGMYWLSASAQDARTSVKQATSRRLSYIATLEVLPE